MFILGIQFVSSIRISIQTCIENYLLIQYRRVEMKEHLAICLLWIYNNILGKLLVWEKYEVVQISSGCFMHKNKFTIITCKPQNQNITQRICNFFSDGRKLFRKWFLERKRLFVLPKQWYVFTPLPLWLPVPWWKHTGKLYL